MPDIAIIGAGPAGSLAAFLLARAGLNVTLIEQHPFPRDKVCGECLSSLALATLRRSQLDRIVAGAAKLTHAILHSTDGRSVRLGLTEPMCGLSRLALDERLLNTVREAGARILQPARCESLTPGWGLNLKSEISNLKSEPPPQPSPGVPGEGEEPGARPRLIVRDLLTNHRAELEPRLVLLADGKGALLPHRPAATADFGIKAHFAGVDGPGDAIQLFGVEGHYGGLAPIESGRFNAAFSVPAARLGAFRGDIDALFQRMLLQNRELRRQFNGARRVSDWCTAPLPRFPVCSTWPRGVIPLGNAAAALEPIGGQGMGLALRSAELAAAAILANPPLPDIPRLRRAFQKLWRIRRPACRLAACVLSSGRVAGPTVELLGANEALGDLALRILGGATWLRCNAAQ